LIYQAKFFILIAIAVLAPLLLFPLSFKAMAVECKPSARIDGDPGAVEDIKAILSEHGLSTEPAEGCPFVSALIENKDGRLHVTVIDPYERTSERLVDDASAAAALIESWVFDNLGMKWIEPRWDRPPPATPPEPEKTPEEPEKETQLVDLFAGAEGSRGTDGSYWAGAMIGGRRHLGPVAPGIQLRFASMIARPDSEQSQSLTRQAVDGLIKVEVPLQFGRFLLQPGIGYGFGWIRTDGEAADPNDPETATRREVFDTWGPLGQGCLALGWDFGNGIRLAIESGFRFYTPGRTDDFVRNGRHLPGEPWGFWGVTLLLM
jgi:hypothetical protein